MVALTADKVVVELEAKVAAYNARIRQSTEQFNKSMTRIQANAVKVESATRRSFGGVSTSLLAIAPAALGAGLGLGALAVGLREIGGLADKFTRFENRLKTAGIEGENLTRVGDKLFDTANRNGVEIEALGSVYARASLASGELGASQAQLDTFVSAVSDGLRVQGSSAEASRGALLQLSQTLGQDIVRGEEFNSILEGALPIAQAAARGIDRFGGSVAKLRAAVISGDVTSKEFFNGILKDAPNLAEQAAKANLTLENSFTALYNQLARGIGQSNKGLGATESLSAGILYLADNLDTVGEAVTVITAAIGSKMVAGLVKAGAEQARFYGTVAAGNAVLIGGATAAEKKTAAEKALSAAVLQEAKAEQARAAALVKSVQADIAAQKASFSRLGGVNSSTPAGAEVQSRYLTRQVQLARDMAGANVLLARSNDALAAAEAKATAATNAHAVALGRTALAARAASLAMRSYAALSGVLGGPVGIALTALAATYVIVSSRTQAAAERTAALRDELRELGYIADDTADKLDGAADSIAKLADDQIRKKITEIKAALDDLSKSGFIDSFFIDKDALRLDQVELFAKQFRTNVNPSIREAGAEIETLVAGLEDGTVSADEVVKRLDKIAKLDLGDGVDRLIGSLRQIAPIIDGAQRRLSDLQGQIGNSIEPKRSRTTVRGRSAAGDRKTGEFLAELDRVAALDEETRAIEKRAEAIKKEADAAGEAMSPITALAKAREYVLGEAARKAAADAQEKLAADAKQSAEVIADLQEAIRTFGNERGRAISDAARSLPEGASAERVEEAKRLAAVLYDLGQTQRVDEILRSDASDAAIQDMKDQAAQIGVVGGALVELRYEQERLNLLRAEGIEQGKNLLTGENIEQIKQQAAALREQWEAQQKINDANLNQIEIMDGIRQGFVDIGSAGIKGFDNLGDAAKRFLEQIAEMILQLYVLKPLMENLFGATGTSGSGAIGGAIGGLFSSGFASGTANTGGVRGQPRGIVHGQEAVIPLPNGGRVPVDLRMPEQMRGGGSGPISVQTNVYVERGQSQTTVQGGDQAQGRELGRVIEQSIRDVMNRERLQGGILWNPGAR